MKDANFDFIKEKFDNCGVHAPAELDADVLTERLPDRPAPVLLPKKSKAKRVAGISAVAAAAVITAGAITFTSMYHQFRPQQPVAATASLRSFQSRDELRQAVSRTIKIRSLNERYIYEERDYEAFADGAVSNEAKQAIPSTHNSTYVQTVGVDEADVVKTTDSHIFYLYGGDSIAIFSAEGKQSKKVAEVTAGDGNISDFFIVGDRLVTLGAADYSYSYDAMTLATVYDISNVGNIRELGTFSQSGSYLSSRMIGDTLYLVSNQYISDENDVPKVSATGSSTPDSATPDSATPDEIPISDIYTVQTPAESTYLVVSQIDTAGGAQATDTKAILGSAGIVYCNRQNLYVTAQEYSPVIYRNLVDYAINSVTDSLPAYREAQETQIIKISLQDGIRFVANGTVRGSVNNQYSLDEYNGNLRVATTSSDEDGDDVNNLFVLDGALNQIGAVTGFAEGESIKAVRYINETAYVITYEQTDPLFAVDTSDPTKPVILGAVKISGFSTLLVPVDDNTLLGIGYHTVDYADDAIDMEIQEGLKLVTFDVSDKSDPKVLDTKVFENYYSEVQYNPKALLVNFERGDYTIPMHYLRYQYATDSAEGEYMPPESKEETYGALNFRVDNGKIVTVDEYVSDLDLGEYGSLDRCAYVGNDIYLLGTAAGWQTDRYLDDGAVIDSFPYGRSSNP